MGNPARVEGSLWRAQPVARQHIKGARRLGSLTLWWARRGVHWIEADFRGWVVDQSSKLDGSRSNSSILDDEMG